MQVSVITIPHRTDAGVTKKLSVIGCGLMSFNGVKQSCGYCSESIVKFILFTTDETWAICTTQIYLIKKI